jgi:hypothetical protein
MWTKIIVIGIGVPCVWWLSRHFALWLFDRVYLDKAAPLVFGWAVWVWPRKVKETKHV